MIGSWESDDIKISLDATDVPGEYIIDAKWSEKYENHSLGKEHWLHERSVGISTVWEGRYSYIEREIKYDTESKIDSTTHGYFASWAKVDDDQNCIRQRKWILNKAFKINILGSQDDVEIDRGSLTTGGLRYRVVRDGNNLPELELTLYNNAESDLFDYLRSLNKSDHHRDVIIYGKNKFFNIQAWSNVEFENDKLELNNRDYLTEKLNDENDTYRVGVWGTYQKGSIPMRLEDVILPDSLPSDISSYKNIREYILDQARKYQISDSDILKAEIGLWKRAGESWVRDDHGNTGYWTYKEPLSMDNPEEFFADLFSESVEIRMLPCAIYPQFQLNSQCLVKINTLLTPFSSYFPYDQAYVQNYRKINDSTLALEVWIRGLCVGEFDINTTFKSDVKEDLLYSTRPAIKSSSGGPDFSYMQGKIYFDDEGPVMLDGYRTNGEEVLDDLYLRQEPILAYRWNEPEFTERRVLFEDGAVRLSTLYTMGSKSMKFPLIRKYTLQIPYIDHLVGEVKIQRNGVTVGTITVDELDYISTFTYERINNAADVDTSYVYPKLEDGVIRPEVHNATLKGRFYDHTRIRFSDNSGIEIDPNNALNHMTMVVSECLGSDRRLVRFNMGTREMLDEDGNVVMDENAPVICKEPIFYDNMLTKNEETSEYELSIYIAARCTRSEKIVGFNDCEVKITFDQMDENGETIGQSTVRYRSVLPPFIVQGIPHKSNPSDPDSVFPDAASRPDVGYYENGETYVIPSYNQNSQSYDRDFFFTNGDPLYVIDTSGFMPSNIYTEYEFDGLEANIIDEGTQSKVPLMLANIASESELCHIDAMNLDNETYEGEYMRSVWTHAISATPGRTYKNIVKVSATVMHRDINN